MKQADLFILTILAALVAFSPSASGDPPDCSGDDATTFIPAEGSWIASANWTEGRPDADPEDLKIACIPPGKTCTIAWTVGGTAVEAAAIYIQADEIDGRGKIFVSNDTVLTLDDYCDSWIEGDLFVEFPGGELVADGDVTIVGNGGDIDGDDRTPEEADPKSAILTTEGSTLTLEGYDNGSRDTSLVVRGAFDIQADLVNNAYVIADTRTVGIINQGDLVLSDGDKSGSGYWMASYRSHPDPSVGTGRLRVEVEVTGGGTWVLADHVNSEIVFNTDCTNLTGPMTIEKGVLMINADVTTTGDLEFASVGGSSPRIEVDEGAVASFN